MDFFLIFYLGRRPFAKVYVPNCVLPCTYLKFTLYLIVKYLDSKYISNYNIYNITTYLLEKR